MERIKGKPDYFLLGTVLILVALGIIILASVSAPLSQENFNNTYYFLNHQLLFGLLLGLILGFFAFKIRLDLLKKLAPVLILLNLIMLAMVFLPKIGAGAGGASRWLTIGPFSLQPSEFLKITFILYLAAWLSSRTEKNILEKTKGAFNQTFIVFLIVMSLVSLLLVFQPDISTLGIIAIVAVIMYFISNTPLWQTFSIILIGITTLFTLIKLAPYRLNRIAVFFNSGIDPMGIGFQIKQALITIGSGGLAGLGLGMSHLQLSFLPESISDSIFAIMAKEMGFIGSFILIALFLIFLWRGFKIGKTSQDKFSQLTAIGISSWIVIQAFINIGSMIEILPLTGIPLPFIGYGGSALVTELIGVGILLNISKQ